MYIYCLFLVDCPYSENNELCKHAFISFWIHFVIHKWLKDIYFTFQVVVLFMCVHTYMRECLFFNLKLRAYVFWIIFCIISALFWYSNIILHVILSVGHSKSKGLESISYPRRLLCILLTVRPSKKSKATVPFVFCTSSMAILFNKGRPVGFPFNRRFFFKTSPEERDEHDLIFW